MAGAGRGTGVGARRGARSAWVSGLALAACAGSAPSLADVRCFSNARYHVVSREHAEQPGAVVAVRALKGAAPPAGCTFDRAATDDVLFGDGPNPPPLYPQALEGDHLVVEEGTGTERGLVVFDLRDRRRILAVPSNTFRVADGVLVYWERIGVARRRDCPGDFDRIRRDGMGVRLAAERAMTLASGVVTRRAGRRCEEAE